MNRLHDPRIPRRTNLSIGKTKRKGIFEVALWFLTGDATADPGLDFAAVGPPVLEEGFVGGGYL